MISIGDFRNDVTFEMDGNTMPIVKLRHVKPGKSVAFVHTKIRNVVTDAVTGRTLNPNDKYPTTLTRRKDTQYLYSDDDLYYFMNNKTYEQIPINRSVLGDNSRFVEESVECEVLPYKDNAFEVKPPNFVELRAAETDPGFKDDTATNATKPVTLEAGAVIRVSLSIDESEMVRIDTRTGKHMKRA